MPAAHWPRPGLLPCDAAVLSFAAAALVYARAVWRSAELRSRWRRVLGDRPAACALVVLCCYGAVATLDSVHFRSLPEAASLSASIDGDSAAATASTSVSTSVSEPMPQRGSGDMASLLDLLLAPLAMAREASYSAPLAVRAWQGGAAPTADGVRTPPPRLLAGGAHLVSVGPRRDDLWRRAATGLAGGVAVSAAFGVLLLTASARRRRTTVWLAACALVRGRPRWPVAAAFCMATLVGAVVGVAVALASGYHLAGTDRTGRDVLLQALKSVRTAVVIGGLSTLATIPPAVVFGVGGGYLGGWFDAAVRYVYTVLSSIPNVLLIAACMLLLQVHIDAHAERYDTALARADLRLFVLCVLLGLTTWTTLCRLLHARTRQLRVADHVLAAIAGGLGPWRIMWRHVLPNVAHLVLITTVLDFSSLVLYEAVLSTIGIGVDPALPSYGGMIDAARSDLARDPVVWWSFATAFVCLCMLVLSANLFADGLRAAFDPQSVALRPRWGTRWRRRAA